MCSCLFISPNGYQPFLFLLHFLNLPHLFTIFITLQLPSSLFSSHHLILPFLKTPSFSYFFSLDSLHLFQWHPRPRRLPTSFPPMHFSLPRWSGAIRLMEFPSLTHRPENHIPMAESINFQFFLIFKFLSNLLF